jgi:hypothetical protein
LSSDTARIARALLREIRDKSIQANRRSHEMTATVAPTSNFMQHRAGANVRVSLNTTQQTRRSKAVDSAVSGSDARSWTSQTSVSATSNQRVGRHSLSSAPTVFRRKIIFLLNQDTGPVFPFNERAQNARSHLRWPPWPHRLDNGHRKVSHGRRTFLSNNMCVISSAECDSSRFIYAAGHWK